MCDPIPSRNIPEQNPSNKTPLFRYFQPFPCTAPPPRRGDSSWSNGYTNRQSITIDNTQVPNTDQINFPFLFRGTYSVLATVANGSESSQTEHGYDIIFSPDPNGLVRLPHEIETYSSTTGNTNMWVQVPLVSHSTNTVFYIFYGSSTITTSQASPTGVWDSNYTLVWHLPNGTTLSAGDSTSNGNGGTITETPTATTAGQLVAREFLMERMTLYSRIRSLPRSRIIGRWKAGSIRSGDSRPNWHGTR